MPVRRIRVARERPASDFGTWRSHSRPTVRQQSGTSRRLGWRSRRGTAWTRWPRLTVRMNLRNQRDLAARLHANRPLLVEPERLHCALRYFVRIVEAGLSNL